MTAAIIISAIVLFFVALGMIPISVKVAAAGKGKEFRAALRICILHIPAYTLSFGGDKAEKSAEPAAEQEPKKKKKQKQKKAAKPQKKEKKSIEDIISLVKFLIEIAKKVLEKTWRYIRIKIERYDITVGTDDAAKTALIYGGVSQATSYLFTLLDETAHFRVKRKAPVNVGVDFLSAETKANVQMDFRLRLWHILSIGLGAGITYLRGMKKNSAKSGDDNKKKNKIAKTSENENTGKAE